MVSAEEEKILGEFQFIAKQQHDAFDRIFTPVDVIPNKKIIGVAGVPAVLEDLQQVTVLSMDIA